LVGSAKSLHDDPSIPLEQALIQTPLDQSGLRITKPARRLSEDGIRSPDGIERRPNL